MEKNGKKMGSNWEGLVFVWCVDLLTCVDDSEVTLPWHLIVYNHI